MKKEEIITLLKDNLIEIIPELEGEEINIEDSLADLGANSIDRGELITFTLETLELDVPRIEFAGVESIKELAEKMYKHGNYE